MKPAGTSKRDCSSFQIICWIGVPPRPPYSAGQVIAAQPPSYFFRCQTFAASQWCASASGE